MGLVPFQGGFGIKAPSGAAIAEAGPLTLGGRQALPRMPVGFATVKYSAAMTHHLMGTAEIADRLGVSRQRVHQIETSDPTFPAPVAELSAGKVWESTDVERWIAEKRKAEPGRRKE
jgi:predicted DNA-binding transcriptional regulator AlpA